MYNREKEFKEKFDIAAKHLGVKPEQVISMKRRDTVMSYSQYNDLVQSLEREAGLQYTEIKDGLQGKGYLLTNHKGKIIIVEHETGLEILYIAGSIASLLGLIPLVLQSWRSIRGHFSKRNDFDNDIEIRRLENGHLREEHAHRMFEDFGTLSSISTLLENEIKRLMEDVKNLNSRVDKIEKQLAVKKKKASKK
ncbi:MAG: hypothetical protein A2Y10_12690 [Planctomycetes bacterium GWF2_41_51]|nr:MAG: hypothetical protein A2Y10_12690 [Planctomycetes bacterium GWF2_41_51]HBG28616.1 hypothetical protein [Phycisphaerales bacterium]